MSRNVAGMSSDSSRVIVMVAMIYPFVKNRESLVVREKQQRIVFLLDADIGVRFHVFILRGSWAVVKPSMPAGHPVR
jgi:hypothetical protein